MKSRISVLSTGAAVLLSAAVTLVPAPAAQALSCITPSLGQQIRSSDVVAIGTVQSYDTAYVPYPPTPGSDNGHEAEVAIERYLKGTGPDEVTVVSYTAAWGRPWRESDVGEQWLLFLRSEAEGGRYVHGACGGSGPLNAGTVVPLVIANVYSPLTLGIAALAMLAGGTFWARRLIRRWEQERQEEAP